MEIPISTLASVALARKFDVFTVDELPKENKRLVMFDKNKNRFYGIYRIPGIDFLDVMELASLLFSGSLYRIIAPTDLSALTFQMKLTRGEEFDFFYTPRHVKENTVYYAENNGQIQGPFVLGEQADKFKLRQKIAAGELYLPAMNQDFQPVSVKKSA